MGTSLFTLIWNGALKMEISIRNIRRRRPFPLLIVALLSFPRIEINYRFDRSFPDFSIKLMMIFWLGWQRSPIGIYFWLFISHRVKGGIIDSMGSAFDAVVERIRAPIQKNGFNLYDHTESEACELSHSSFPPFSTLLNAQDFLLAALSLTSK